MKSLTVSCLLAGCIALMILSGCAIDITGSVSAYGDTLWQRKCFYGNTWSLAGFKDVLADEQGYLMVGHSDRTLLGRDGSLVVRTDYEGNLVWYHTENNFEGATKILLQSDGSLLVLHGRDSLTKFAAE